MDATLNKWRTGIPELRVLNNDAGSEARDLLLAYGIPFIEGRDGVNVRLDDECGAVYLYVSEGAFKGQYWGLRSLKLFVSRAVACPYLTVNDSHESMAVLEEVEGRLPPTVVLHENGGSTTPPVLHLGGKQEIAGLGAIREWFAAN